MFDNISVCFEYFVEGEKRKKTFSNSIQNADFIAKINLKESSGYKRLILSILPSKKIEIDEIKLSMDFVFSKNQKIFVNGYQSWTDSREFFIDEKIKSISKLARPIMKKYQFDKYGDYSFKKYSEKSGEFHGYTYSYIRENKQFNFIGSLSEKQGYTIIQENISKNKITIEKDCKGLNIDTEYKAFDLVWAEGSEEFVFDKYFELMDIEKAKCKPMTGWTSWYNYYQDINQDIIIENLNNFKSMDKNIDIFQIDDGYQTAVGDWLLVDKNKFPEGMKYIADNIKLKGYQAGIWLAPFVCETNSYIFKAKKEWILKDDKGELVLAGSNWSRFYALDFYNIEVREYIKKVFSVILNDWGYDMVKLDFLYAVCLIPSKDRTRGQIMTEAMEFLRECVGEKLILGCGVPLGPSFGLVDYCRIGCDVGLDWDDKPYMRLLHRERVSTLNAIRNAIGRRQLNGRAFLNDPDVFLLRDENISLTKIQKNTLSIVNSIFGSLIFTSDNIQKYDAEKHEIFDKIMSLEAKVLEEVETLKNGLVKAVYYEGESKLMALINLSSESIDYENTGDRLKERMLEDKLIYKMAMGKITLKPYESRVFILKEIA